MSVQLSNALLGVRRVEAAGYDAHGSPLPGPPAAATTLLPGKVMELDTGGWQLALDPALWPVRVGDVVVTGTGWAWRATLSKLLQAPALEDDERVDGIDMDVSFIRVMANEVTTVGTEPIGGEFVGR